MGAEQLEQVFKSFIWNVYALNRQQLAVLLLDNYMLFKDKDELELLIKRDLTKLLLSKGLMHYKDVFIMPDKSTEFDPPVSDYRTVILFKLSDRVIINLDINLNVNRPETIVRAEALTTMSIMGISDWTPIHEDHNDFEVSFMELSAVRSGQLW